MRRIQILALGLLASASCSSTGSSTQSSAEPVLVSKGTALVVEDMSGERHELGAGSDSGPVALVFWQTWCASCKRESPDIIAAAAAHEEITFFGVVPGLDADVDDAEVLQVAADWELPYTQIRDRDLALTELFGVTGTPDIVVLDGEGRVLYRGHRPPEDWGALL